MVVAADISENFRNLAQVRRVVLEENLCRLRIAEDGPQRLVELVEKEDLGDPLVRIRSFLPIYRRARLPERTISLRSARYKNLGR